ncbi:hypothetical protein Q762_15065 [Flavobacterium cauense R2A-7]|nr:hypothetical protein Q762_15065 [Flavobacterium cauense R2A-7]
MFANVPPALCWWGFLLLMFTNIPKSLKEESRIGAKAFESSSFHYTPKPHLHKTAVMRRSFKFLNQIFLEQLHHNVFYFHLIPYFPSLIDANDLKF